MTDFPLGSGATPPPAYFTRISFPDRNGLFYTPSPTISFTLDKSGANAYTVEDVFGIHGTVGAIISSGSISGTSATASPPSGGWKAGWFRLRLTGPSTDPTFGISYGASMFSILVTIAGYPTTNTAPGNNGTESRDSTLKNILGMGASRFIIDNATTPTVGTNNWDTIADNAADAAHFANYRSDPVRPRPLTVNLRNGTSDFIIIPGSPSGQYIKVYLKDGTIDGGNVFVRSGPGTTTGTKITVYFPNNTTVAETYDNLTSSADATNKINVNGNAGGPSNFLHVFSYGAANAAIAGPTAVGNAYRNGVIQVVQGLYPAVTRFEGPGNEPPLTSLETPHQMRYFRDLVHTVPGALAIGPTPVTIDVAQWKVFLDNGGGEFCDEFSAHPYDGVPGEINSSRSLFQDWIDLLAAYGYGAKRFWSTEPTGAIIPRLSVAHWRQSRLPLIITLLWEQLGLPAEFNQLWYDKSHGFWDFAAWFENGDGSVLPFGPMFRTLHAERYGKLHHHRIDFGASANHIFLGSVYRSPIDGSGMAVVVSESYMGSQTVTFTVVGQGDGTVLTAVDAWGNPSPLTVAGNKVTLPISDIPSYLRLPSGTNVYIAAGDIGSGWGVGPSISPAAKGMLDGSVAAKELCDNAYQLSGVNYGSPGSGVASSGVGLTGSNASTADLLWLTTVSLSGIIVVGVPPYQIGSSLVTFKVQTTADDVSTPAAYAAATWTDRRTIDVSGVTFSTIFGTDATNVGCRAETSWPEQFNFDISLGGTFSVKGVRVRATVTSQGGEPDLTAVNIGGLGAGQQLHISEIIAPSVSTPTLFSPPSGTVVGAFPGLVGYWRLDELTGTVARSKVNTPALDATISGSPKRGLPGLAGDSVASQMVAGSGAVTASSSLFIVGDTLTIGASFFGYYPYGPTDLMAQTLAFSNNWILRVNGSGIVELLGPSGQTPIVSSSVAANLGGWNRVFVTKSGSAVKLYLNGVDVTVVGTNQTLAAVNWPITIAGGQGSPFGGAVEDYVLCSVPLAPANIAADWAALPIQGVPVNITQPTVEGTPAVGNQVSVIAGKWISNPTKYPCQWQSSPPVGGSFTDIPGATRSDYMPVPIDGGKLLRCNVAAGNTAGTSSSVASTTIGPVTGGTFAPSAFPPVGVIPI